MRTVSIIGLGLIGGSLGLALKRSGRWHVVGYARRSDTVRLALERGAVDHAVNSLQDAANADVIIVSTPVMAVKEIFSQIASELKPDCVVSDVASTKVQVMKWAGEVLPSQVNFIGGHPMAGKETAGLEVADPDLFKGCTYCLVSGESAGPEALEIMTGLVSSIGARPFIIEAERHDYLVAGISHLPLLISTALVNATTENPAWAEMASLASSGYRDASRLASTHPVMSRDIFISNRGPVLQWLDDYIAALEKFRQIIDSPEQLEKAFDQACRLRQEWLDKKGQNKTC